VRPRLHFLVLLLRWQLNAPTLPSVLAIDDDHAGEGSLLGCRHGWLGARERRAAPRGRSQLRCGAGSGRRAAAREGADPEVRSAPCSCCSTRRRRAARPSALYRSLTQRA
jgi:hypothetical protein